MEVAPMGSLPYCKGLWSVVSGTTCRCDKDLVEDEIKNAAALLKNGLGFFEKYTESSLRIVYERNPPPRMYDLVAKLAPLLNLDATITWDLVCNFMLYEYRNCAETFASQLTDLTTTKSLVEEIWNFYYSERTTLIKCLKLMVEYRDDKRHPYQKQFLEFFDEVLLGNLLKSVQGQIEALKFIDPPVRSHHFTDDHLHRLYNSSLVEMRELLHVFAMILHDIHVAEGDFHKVYGSISGEPRRLIAAKSHEDKEAVERKLDEIRHAQVAVLLVALDTTRHSGMEEWIKAVRDEMRDVFEHKCLRGASPQDGPLLLAWMLANYATEPENADALARFRPYGIRALQLDVFRYLRRMLDAETIREDTRYASVVRGSVYDLLALLGSFVEEDRISTLHGIFDAVAAVVRYPEIATRFWQEEEDGGLWLFYKCAIEWFPYKFQPLTVIAAGLVAASTASAKRIVAELDDLPSVMLEGPRDRDPREPLRPYERDCTIHRNPFTVPRRCEHEVIESGSERELVLWRVKSNYWDAFHHKIEELFSRAAGGIANASDAKTDLPEHVLEGLRLLESILASDVELPASMVIPTELSFEVINRFSYPSLPSNVYRIVAECVRVSSRLVLKYPEDVLARMRTGVYPRFTNRYQKPTDFARAVSFDGGLVASWLSGIETIEHVYPVLAAYLDILSNYLVIRHSEEAMFAVEIPGMVLLLQGVLPKLDSWYFASDTERIDLWLKSMFCLHHALDANLPRGDPRHQLQLIVAHSLLYLEPRHALLKLARTGERTLRNKMLTESDWVSGRGFKIIKSVQLALSVMNRLLMLRKSLGLGVEQRSPLEVALYTSPSQPNGLLIVPTIVNYLYVWFSPSLQAMAVRLLKKFAEGFSMSLLVCMGMDGTAIRETFASRLMSSICSAEVKVAILELVAVCLERQPGLTEALFNIMHQAERRRIFPRPADEFLTQGCSQFLHLYLKRIHREENIVYDRLFDSTMGLLHAMWYHRNEILVNYFRKRQDFWTHLFAPLFRRLAPDVKGYGQLLDIVTLELFKNPAPESDFSANLKELTDQRRDRLEKLAEYALGAIPEESPEESSRAAGPPLYEVNLESWYHFVVTLTDERFSANYPVNAAQARLIASLALSALATHIARPYSSKIMNLLASLSLRCVTAWREMCVGDTQAFKGQLVSLTREMAQSYRSYGKPLRQTLLSLLVGCVQLAKDALSEDSATLEFLLGNAATLATVELEELKEAATDERRLLAEKAEKAMDSSPEMTRGARECVPATLTICMVAQLLRLRVERAKPRGRANCTALRQMIPELMVCLGITLQRRPYFRFSRTALAALGVIARSPYGPSLIAGVAIVKLWLRLIPPQELKNSMVDSLYDDRTSCYWRCQDWWPLYMLGLEFVTGLISNDNCTIYTPIVVMYLGSHEHQLMEVSTLLRHTADPLAAELIQSLVALTTSVAVRPAIWNSIQPSVRETLFKCLFLAYDSTVNLLLRPRILKFIIDGISVESAEELQSCDEKPPSGDLCLLVNKLVLINISCAQSFVRFSPKLNTLVDAIYTQDFWYAPMAEMNFGPPQMSMSSGPRLTYGTIISSAQLFTQALHSRASSTSASVATHRRLTHDDNGGDSARREWERATPESLRRIHTRDLKKILHPGASDFSGYISGLDATVPLLSSPRLVRRPYDPLICENTILSRATALAPNRRVSRGGSPGGQQSGGRQPSDPWFSSMEENNTRLALEVNLVLMLTQALEGVKSPRLALRDRQLIVRETATEMGVFFDFLEQRGTSDRWQLKFTLVDADVERTRTVRAPTQDPPLPARLSKESAVCRAPVCRLRHEDPEEVGSERREERLDECVVTTGSFRWSESSVQFLPLLGKLLKSVVESLDSAQYG